LLFSIS